MNIGIPELDRLRRSMLLGLLTIVLSLATSACGGDQSADFDLPQRARNDNLSTAGRTLATADLNGDGLADQWLYLDATAGNLVRAERDIDFDGRVDLYEYYDGEGNLIEEEMHLDFDDHIDVVRYYRGEALTRRELSTGFDGRFAMVKYYDVDGNVLRVERDSNGDGRIDTWEYYDGEELVRVGRDEDGDGQPELVDSAP